MGQFCNISNRQWLVTRNSPICWNRCCSLFKWRFLSFIPCTYKIPIWSGHFIIVSHSAIRGRKKGLNMHFHFFLLELFQHIHRQDHVDHLVLYYTKLPGSYWPAVHSAESTSSHRETERGRNRASSSRKMCGIVRLSHALVLKWILWAWQNTACLHVYLCHTTSTYIVRVKNHSFVFYFAVRNMRWIFLTPYFIIGLEKELKPSSVLA